MAFPILGMISILFGILVIVFPGFLRMLIGIYCILVGIALFLL